MLYQREIDDSVLIQFIILFTLTKADEDLAYSDLVNLVLENCNINFTDFQLALDNLLVTKHIRQYILAGNIQKFAPTDKGAAAVEFFTSHIPIYIREPILDSIKEMYIEKRRKNAVKGDIIPVRRNEYAAECHLYDDDKTELMGLTLYAGSRAEEERIAVYFKEHYGEVYEAIVNAFPEKPSEDD